MKILVIEENLSRRKIIHRKIQLTKINSTIVLVKNIRQALNYLKYSSIDLILINKQLFNLLTEIQKKLLINKNVTLLTTRNETLKSKYSTLFIEAEVSEYKNLLTKNMAKKPKIKALSKREKEIYLFRQRTSW